jgi:hypothetical protein
VKKISETAKINRRRGEIPVSLPARLYGITLLTVAILLQASCTLNAHDVAPARPASASTPADGRANNTSALTIDEAKSLINLLPAVEEIRAKGIDVKWDLQSVPDMNNQDYYFFWIYSVTAQKERDTGSISVGNYAVNKYTADVRSWQVSPDVYFGDDGVLVNANGLESVQGQLRKKHGVTTATIQEYRSAHLAKRIIPREQAQSAAPLPVTWRSNKTAEVSCWGGSDHLISRLGRSPVISSSAGYRAYAEVEATAFRPKYQETYAGSLCENRVRLFLAIPGASSFQTILDSNSPKGDCVTLEGADSCDVKGVEIVDWSRDGRFLLANLVLWVYESDALVMRVPVIYNAAKNEFTRPDVYHFFDEYYKTDFFKSKPDPTGSHCEFELRAEAFAPDGNLILSVSRPPDDPTADEPVFCVDKKQAFQFELETNKIKRLPFDYKRQRYGTVKTQSAPKP